MTSLGWACHPGMALKVGAMGLIAGLQASSGDMPIGWDAARIIFSLICIFVAFVGMIVAVVCGVIQAVRGPQEPGTEVAPGKEAPGGRIEWRSDSMRPDMPHETPATHGSR